jgi:hypothetical protein
VFIINAGQNKLECLPIESAMFVRPQSTAKVHFMLTDTFRFGNSRKHLIKFIQNERKIGQKVTKVLNNIFL